MNKQTSRSPLVLCLVIALGVAAGNLLSDIARYQWAAFQAQRLLSQLAAENRQAAGAARVKRQARDRQAQMQRAASDPGRALHRECLEWQQADQTLQTYTTGREKRRACQAYDTFIRGG